VHPWIATWIASTRLADLDESAVQVAVMLTDAGLGAVAGAVYNAASVPVAVIVPTAEFPFGTPLTAQLTLVSGCPVLVTVARSWTIPAGKTDDMPGGFVATVTPITAGCLDELFPQPPKSMREGEERSATTAMARAQKEERAGKDARSPRLTLVSVMVSPIHCSEIVCPENLVGR
jgi:hypothetical protein